MGGKINSPVALKNSLAINAISSLNPIPGKEKEAERESEYAFELDPLDSVCLEAKGILKLSQGSTSEARRLLEQAAFLGSQQAPSATRILKYLKRYKPQRREAPDALWKEMRSKIKLR